jgi:plasmid stabilization system protein ParE
MDGKISEIIWTETSINDLKIIFDYYHSNASHQVAHSIIKKIQDKVDVLYFSAFIGQEELLLQHLNLGIRYLVEGNYKIFYHSFQQKVFVLFIFDCRQNPQKLENLFG